MEGSRFSRFWVGVAVSIAHAIPSTIDSNILILFLPSPACAGRLSRFRRNRDQDRVTSRQNSRVGREPSVSDTLVKRRLVICPSTSTSLPAVILLVLGLGWDDCGRFSDFRLRGSHPLRPAFPCRSPSHELCNSLDSCGSVLVRSPVSSGVGFS
jgi:hypothetical protein